MSVTRRDRLVEQPPAYTAAAGSREGGGTLLRGALEEIQPWLMPRVMLREQAAQAGEVIEYGIGDRLSAVLGVQDPEGSNGLYAIGPSDAARLGVAPEQMWAWGVENLHRDQTTIRALQTTMGGTVNAVLANSTYGATHVLRLGYLLDEPAPYGALVTVPHVSTVIFLVLHSHVDMRMVPYLMELGTELQQGDGNALSTELYWWTPEGIEPQGVTLQGERATLNVSQRFREILNRLPQTH